MKMMRHGKENRRMSVTYTPVGEQDTKASLIQEENVR